MEIGNGTGPLHTGPLPTGPLGAAASTAAPAAAGVEPPPPAATPPLPANTDGVKLGSEATAALAATSEAPPAPPPAPPRKKKRRGLFGRIRDAVKGAVKAVGTFVKKNATYLLAAAQVLCYCFPVLAPLGVALTVYQGATAAKQMVQGIASGDWKTAVLGLVSMAGSFAGGVSAVANGALGGAAAATAKGLEVAAKTVGKVADGIKAVQGVIDAAKTGRIGSALSGVVGFIGDNTQWLSEKTLGVAEKVANYAQRIEQGVDAVKNKNFGSVASLAAGVASDLGGDLRLNETTRGKIDQVADKVRVAGAAVDAIRDKDFAAAGQALGGAIKDEKLAKAVTTAGTVAGAIQGKDFAAAGQALGGAIKDEKLARAVTTAGTVAGAIQGKDLAAAGQALGGAIKDEKLSRAVTTAGAVADALKKKDPATAANVLGGAVGNEKLSKAISASGQLAKGVKARDSEEILAAAESAAAVLGTDAEARRKIEEAATRARNALGPTAAVPARPTQPGGERHTVKPGETLSRIAREQLGDANRWREIYDLNRDQIKNPNVIQPGQQLKLPPRNKG